VASAEDDNVGKADFKIDKLANSYFAGKSFKVVQNILNMMTTQKSSPNQKSERIGTRSRSLSSNGTPIPQNAKRRKRHLKRRLQKTTVSKTKSDVQNVQQDEEMGGMSPDDNQMVQHPPISRDSPPLTLDRTEKLSLNLVEPPD